MNDFRIAEPFHEGELRAQRLAGGGPAGAPIRDRMPEQHRQFFPLLRFLCVAAEDATGWPLATLVYGQPGFVSSPDPARLRIGAQPDPQDPVRACLRIGARVGLLGIDLATRRRNRANGIVGRLDEDGLLVHVHESFGNCPKYIRSRELTHVQRRAGDVEAFGAALPADAAALIRACDTMFVASSSGKAGPGLQGGLDISHRGGEPGFLDLQGKVLRVPDYAGNRYFNTLGNFLQEPRASLVIADFSSGDVLQLQGVADVAWPAAQGEGQPGRSWSFEIVRGWLWRGRFPLTDRPQQHGSSGQ